MLQFRTALIPMDVGMLSGHAEVVSNREESDVFIGRVPGELEQVRMCAHRGTTTTV